MLFLPKLVFNPRNKGNSIQEKVCVGATIYRIRNFNTLLCVYIFSDRFLLFPTQSSLNNVTLCLSVEHLRANERPTQRADRLIHIDEYDNRRMCVISAACLNDDVLFGVAFICVCVFHIISDHWRCRRYDNVHSFASRRTYARYERLRSFLNNISLHLVSCLPVPLPPIIPLFISFYNFVHSFHLMDWLWLIYFVLVYVWVCVCVYLMPLFRFIWYFAVYFCFQI